MKKTTSGGAAGLDERAASGYEAPRLDSIGRADSAHASEISGVAGDTF